MTPTLQQIDQLRAAALAKEAGQPWQWSADGGETWQDAEAGDEIQDFPYYLYRKTPEKTNE